MISKFSVKKPYTVIVGIVLIIVMGIVAFTKMTTDLLPSMELPYVMILTTYPGASPEQVEMAVSKPVEQAMASVNNVKTLQSISNENYSMVMIEFNSGTDMDTAAFDMKESLDMISGYWDESIGTPTIMKLNPSMMPVMVAAVDVDDMAPAELSDYVDSNVVSDLEAVEGVASVTTIGSVEESVQVVLQQEKIDSVNDRVAASLNQTFADAEETMANAKNQLNAGQSELDIQRKQVLEQLNAGQIGLIDGKTQVSLTEQSLTEALQKLLESESELLQKENDLTTSLQGLKSLKTTYDSLSKQKSDLETVINNPNIPAEAKQQAQLALVQVNQGIAQLQLVVDQMNQGLTQEQKISLQTLDTSIEQLEGGLASIEAGKLEIENGKNKISEGLTQVTAGKVTLDDKMSELLSARSDAEAGFTTAQTQINSGKSELEKAETDLETTKEQALEGADLHTIITADMVKGMLTAQNFSMPAGYVTEEHVDYLIRVGDKFDSVDEMADFVLLDLGMDGVDPIKLSDVADVAQTDNSADSYTKINGNNGILLSVSKQTNYSTADVSKSIKDKFDKLADAKEGLHFTALMDQGLYIEMIVQSVLQNLGFGAILAILILLLFLKDIRPTGIIAVSIPVSVIFAIVLMYFSGVTLNVISLSGLALGVGMLVDNSIVVIENIYRLRRDGMEIREAAIKGAQQVTGAITASTLTTVSVFLPIVFTTGITRQLFVDMALTIGYSLLASLVIAITFVPMVAAGTMKNISEKRSAFFEHIVVAYDRVLRVALKHKAWVMIFVVIALIASAVGAVASGTSMMPSMDSPQMTLTMVMPEGTVDKNETIAMSDEVIERALEIEDIDKVGAMLGGGSMSMMGLGSDDVIDQVSMYILCKDDKKLSNEEIAKLIEDKTADLDCEITIQTSAMDLSALGTSGVSILVKGKDLDKLQEISTDLASKLGKIDGLEEVSNGVGDTTPELRICVDKDKAAEYGLTVAQVYQAVAAKLKGEQKATTLSSDTVELNVYVKDGTSAMLTPDDIRAMTVEGTKEKETVDVKLSDIATIENAKGMNTVTRYNQSRYLNVTAAVKSGYNVGLVSQKVEKTLKNYEIPQGYTIEFNGENETTMEALGQVALMLVLALVFMYLIMVAQFQSLKSPFIIMFTVPLAFTGGFLALLIARQDVSVIAMIGFVMLCGVIVNNGIVFVDSVNQYREEGMEIREAILITGRNRLRPIIMTALTTILGLSTMALGLGMGSDMAQPMAVVTIGGMIYGTLLTLLVVPCIYEVFNHDNKQPRKNRRNKGGKKTVLKEEPSKALAQDVLDEETYGE